MSRYKYSKTEQQINNVLAYHEKELAGISFPNLKEMDASIAKAESQLKDLGIDIPQRIKAEKPAQEKKVMLIPSGIRWSQKPRPPVGAIMLWKIYLHKRSLRATTKQYSS